MTQIIDENAFLKLYMFVKILKESAVIMKWENYDNILPFWMTVFKEQAPRQFPYMSICSFEKPTSTYGITFKQFFFNYHLEIRIFCKQKSGRL